MNEQAHDHLAMIAELLHELGYQGAIDEGHGIVTTGAGGLKSTIASHAGSDIQLRCLIVGVESVSPLALNRFNRRYRFAKTYSDEEGDVFLEADFLFAADSEEALDTLGKIMSLWESFVSGFREMLVTENGQAERASPEGAS